MGLPYVRRCLTHGNHRATAPPSSSFSIRLDRSAALNVSPSCRGLWGCIRSATSQRSSVMCGTDSPCRRRQCPSRVHSDSRFAVLLFLDPPVPLVVSPVFPRCTGVCVFVPCGILRAPWPSEWSRERSAPSSVARVCRLLPLFAQG